MFRQMERVLGLGGVFFKAQNPKALTAWYRDHLGVPVDENGYVVMRFGGEPASHYQVWSAFPSESNYYPGPLMVNFRVADLDKMLAQLRAAGVTVDEKIDDSEYGRFGWCVDPEGNRVELWQPPKSP
jgi:predicted enzyme related to lactoylglutathione lyase